MIIGDTEFRIVSGGRFKLDGGSMFGIVPKPLWTKLRTPDDQNRIDMATNCLLVRTQRHLILIDTGYGMKMSEKERDIYGMQGSSLVDTLNACGVQTTDIDIVILTHLHFDHAGGATIADLEGHLYPTFPGARYFVQRAELNDALNGYGTMTATYREENYQPLLDHGLLTLIDGESEICPGVRVEVTGGHTRAHQLVKIQAGPTCVVYAGDILPTFSHMRGPYNMAYDLFPYETMTRKQRVLEQAAAEGWGVVWDHDPLMGAARIVVDDKGNYKPEPVDLI